MSTRPQEPMWGGLSWPLHFAEEETLHDVEDQHRRSPGQPADLTFSHLFDCH